MRTPIRKNADRRPSDEILPQHQNTTAKIVLLTEKDQSIVWKNCPAPFHCLAAQNLDTGLSGFCARAFSSAPAQHPSHLGWRWHRSIKKAPF